VLKAEHTLATIYAGQRRFDEAAQLLERVIAAHARAYGADHLDTLRFTFDLSALLTVNGKPDRGAVHAARVAEGRRRTLGPGHRDTIAALAVLATAHETRKQPAEAIRVATQAYESARRAFGEDDALTRNMRAIVQRATLAAAQAKGGEIDRAARDEVLANAARSFESAKATSLLDMINLAGNRALVAVQQGRPQDGEAPLLEALDAARRAGQEEPNLTAILAGVYALQKKYGEAEATIARVVARPDTWKALNPILLPFALRSLGNAYRNERRFEEAERHFRVLVPLVLTNPGETAQQTRVDLQMLADTYASLDRYDDAERWFAQLLDIQRRTTGPEHQQTLLTMTNLGWTRLQQGRYADAERLFSDVAVVLTRTMADSWERFNVESMLGASLSGQRRFADAEPLLVSGYEGMATRKPASNPNLRSRFTLREAGAAVLRLYDAWGNPAKRAEWATRLETEAR
jgi:tetratricopeptide (TPR) repeat protein